MMRIAEVHPEAERLVLRTALEESRGLLDGLGVGAALHDIEAVLEGLVAALLQEPAELVITLAGAVEVIGPPDNADVIAGLLLEDFRERDHVAGERRREARDAGGHGRTTAEVGRAGRYALRGGREEPAELDALAGELVQSRRADVGIAVAAQVGVTMVVGQQEQDVGLLSGRQKDAEAEPAQQGSHGVESPKPSPTEEATATSAQNRPVSARRNWRGSTGWKWIPSAPPVAEDS